MRRFFLILPCLLILIIMIHAQEPDSGWEIIERCVGEPTIPPDDWTFEGTILATGWAGIHGINADWDTPVVQVFREQRWLDIYFHDTGIVEHIWTATEERRLDDFEWSSDSRYLSFRDRSIYSDGDPARTFVVDMQSREIYPLCTFFDSSAWSLNGNQLSATLPDDDTIYIFDISNWQLMNTYIP